MWMLHRRHNCIRPLPLITTCTTCAILVFVYFVLTGRMQNRNTKNTVEMFTLSERLIEEACIPVCDSKECISQANILLKDIDTKIDPCENFNTFLCGSLEDKLDPTEDVESGLRRAETKMLNEMTNIIENLEATSGNAALKIKIVYDSCVKIGSSDLRGIDDFRQFLNTVGISNWPHLSEDFSFSEVELPALLGNLNAKLLPPLLSIKFGATSENNANEFLEVSFYYSPERLEKDVAVDILEYFDIETEDIELILNDYENVKNNLLRLDIEDSEFPENNGTDVLIYCLRQEDNAWKYLCQTVEAYLKVLELEDNLANITISVDEFFVFSTKNFLPRLKSLPDRSVANFFAIKMLFKHLDEINFFFRLKKQKHYRYFNAEEKTEIKLSSKRVYCTEWIGTWMQIPLQNEYFKKHSTISKLNELMEIHKNYTAEMGNMIQMQDWIFSEKRTSIENWVNSSKSNFFRLLELFPNDSLIDDYLKMFNPTPTSFFMNALEVRKNIMRVRLTNKFNTGELQRTRFVVNGDYSEESVTFGYGIVYPPFFYPGHKKIMNRILFAFVILHEIGHGIERMLSNIDSEADNITKKSFLEKRNCLENQFSSYKFKYLGENLNGSRYFEENIADSLAQAVVDKMIGNFESSLEAFSLPGLIYSPTQQLYMVTKQEFCSKSSFNMDIYYKAEESHAPFEYRIIGTLQNSRGFSEAFDCKERSYMNPSEKCLFLD